ncbi:gliding motility-associated C-terminal domain-containing protein [Mucilaginibacter ginsenosidivorax]|uniref:Gliding motility-associated C-terminal domain-containing protein n=1 Tax=Mucilaginibacter ginsenosidivorax TaxID=862126 RepID=A0A5B8W0U1_9SPHI|nr:gliding motility-associated C-terminal domain-containing protein [Mucilaginibacter ginsenosidivorax]QEC77261.1 gliding motility-associated C-terminal domain-containing protein [Mucilaginibacter ginsenosidivorax]
MRLPKHMGRRALLLLLFLFICFRSVADTFVVTSNADSGPGTLREALTLAAANDSTQTDYINFSLTDISEAGRTLYLKSQLPDISSNLVIDGSTQTGTYFGVSTAKVALFFNPGNNGPLNGLSIINKHNVTILGLYLKYFKSSGPDSAGLNYRTGIYIVNSDNIIFGQALKGNVVIGFSQSLTTSYLPANNANYSSNITIKASFFSIDADGETLPVEQEQALGLAYLTGSIKVGGTEIEGNVLANGVVISQQNSYASYDTITAHFYIRNNKIGVNYSVTKEILTSAGIFASTVDPDGSNYLDIDDNVITGNAIFGDAIYPINMGRQINIRRNYIGTDKTRTRTFKTGGIFLYSCTGQVSIGSSDPADANYITNCVPVIVWPYTNAKINKNSFYCPTYVQPMHYVGYGEFDAPQVNITKILPTVISGTATPNSTIELFYDDKCGTCSPQTYFASTTADAKGNWKYTGPSIHGTIIASATNDKNTSDFTKTTINVDNVKVINACDNTGSIIGAVPQSASEIRWVNENGKTVSTDADLIGVKPGKYKLIVKNGGCGDSTSYFEIQQRFLVDTTKIIKVQPSCNGATGSISSIQFAYNDNQTPIITWTDAANKIWGNNVDVSNLPAGKYTLIIKSFDATCVKKYGPFILKNTTGPTIDDSKPNVTNTNCGQTIGSITNIIVTGGTGTRHFTWKNVQQQEVAYTQDLTGQPAGKYTLQVTDDSQCGPVYSKEIEITEVNGISITESLNATTPASCGKANGAVTGVTATGGTKYEWRDTNGNLAGTSLDLKNVPGGAYQLTVSNAFCQKQSKVYQVTEQSGTVFPSTYTVNHIDACYGKANGALQVNQDALIKAVRWVNAAGVDVAMHHGATDLAAGNYKLYLTDQNGCESYYNTYRVDELPELKVTDNGQTGNEQCGLKSGYVSNVTVAGGLPPYTYTWLNAGSASIGTTSSISNLAAGAYTLNIADSRCGSINVNYQIQNIPQDLAAPSVSDIQVCSPGDAILLVNNAAADVVYRLYDQADSTSPLSEQTGGRFKIVVTANRSFFVSQVNGTCESPKTEVKVSVGLSPLSIANSFTPNGDGHNDYWKINNIESYPSAVVQVFNRNGQKLFESKGYATPFNGTYNGKALPVGTYYYIINLNKNCNLLSGSLTILR